MSKAETSILSRDETAREELIWPRDHEQPVILVRENRETKLYEAISSIKLIAVGSDRGGFEQARRALAESRRSAEDYISILTPGLNAGQRLDFVYRVGRDELGRERFDWNITIRGGGATVETARKSLDHIWQNQRVAMGSIKHAYRFAPVVDPEELKHDEEQSTWTATIKPVGVPIESSHKQLGFVPVSRAELEQHRTVVVPYAISRRRHSFDSVISGAFQSPCPIKIVLSVVLVALSQDSLKSVARALAWLRNVGPQGIKYFQGVEESLIEEDGFTGLLHILQNWLRNPTGYKARCSVASRHPLPSSLLYAIGRDVFHGQPMTVTSQKGGCAKAVEWEGEGGSSPTTALDLRGMANGCGSLPPIFPGIATLSSIGFERFHALPVPPISEAGILLGHTDSESRQIRFDHDDRSSHTYIVGATGVGKSTLIFNMITQDIRNGEGVALIDPHGDLYRQVIESIPRERVRDVVLVDFSDFENTVAINFLECEGKYRRTQMGFVVNEMINIFDRLYDLEKTGGPMFEQYMRNALLLAMDSDFPGATLMDIPWIFEDREYRRFLVGKCKNPFVVDFWTKQAERAVGESSLNSLGPYITSKLNQFTTNPLIRPVIGKAHSTINFRQVMDGGQILLVNLSKGQLSELDSKLLGMLITGKVFCAAMERSTLRPDQRRRFYLYVDEFQNFVSDTVSSILSESRKFGLHLTLANQNLGQLTQQYGRQQVLDAVLSNCGSTLFFRLGAIDAGKLQAYTAPELAAVDLQELPNHRVAARLMVNNKPTRPFIFKTLKRAVALDSVGTEEVIESSRESYTVPTAAVEEEILNRRNSYLTSDV